MDIVVCWRCEQPGHGWRECQRPAARTETELKARFARYMELRIAGRISTATKRAWVTSEWKAFNDR
jgi:hypothetical protein